MRKIEYPYLPEGRTISYVPENNPFMQAAKHFALTESTDRKVPTGAIIVDGQGEILVAAANQSKLKNRFLLETHRIWCVRRIFKIASGKKYWLCIGCSNYKQHAEYRAVELFQKKFLENIHSDIDLYLWGHWWCCKSCWGQITQSGIRNVYLMEGSDTLFVR